MDAGIIGAIKIKDGLFVGDEFAAQDLEFVVANKVTRIINCAARQVPNHWEPIGVQYLSFTWLDHESQVLFDAKGQVFEQIYNFIDQGLENADSVLVHSVRGQSRCLAIAAAYIMRKFRWTLMKSLEFVNFRRPDMDLRQSFVQQLGNLETKLQRSGLGPKSDNWTELAGEPSIESEELVLRNTFLNAQIGPMAENSEADMQKEYIRRLNWSDMKQEDEKIQTDVQHPQSKNKVEDGFAIVKSCVKGNDKSVKRFPVQNFNKPKQRPNFSNFVARQNEQRKNNESSFDELQKVANEVHMSIFNKNDSPQKKAGNLSRGNVRGNSLNSRDKQRKQPAIPNRQNIKLPVRQNEPRFGPLKPRVPGSFTGKVKKRPTTAPNNFAAKKLQGVAGLTPVRGNSGGNLPRRVRD